MLDRRHTALILVSLQFTSSKSKNSKMEAMNMGSYFLTMIRVYPNLVKEYGLFLVIVIQL